MFNSSKIRNFKLESLLVTTLMCKLLLNFWVKMFWKMYEDMLARTSFSEFLPILNGNYFTTKYGLSKQFAFANSLNKHKCGRLFKSLAKLKKVLLRILKLLNSGV